MNQLTSEGVTDTRSGDLEIRERGSARLIEAWEKRGRSVVTDEDIATIAEHLDASPATVARVIVTGGREATGLGLVLDYDGDDGPRCGNDMEWLIQLLRHHGGDQWQVPVIIKNGQPAFERITVLAALGVLPANAFDAVVPMQIDRIATIGRAGAVGQL